MSSPGNTKGVSITLPLTSSLTGLDQSALQINTKIVSCHIADSKPVKQEVKWYSDTSCFSTPLAVYLVSLVCALASSSRGRGFESRCRQKWDRKWRKNVFFYNCVQAWPSSTARSTSLEARKAGTVITTPSSATIRCQSYKTSFFFKNAPDNQTSRHYLIFVGKARN